MENQITNTEAIKNAVIAKIKTFNMEEFGEHSWGLYEGSQGALSEKAMIKNGIYNQDAWNFIQKNMEGEYQEFYFEYMQEHIIPAYVKAVMEEEEITEEEAYEEAYEEADELQSTYWSVQHFFAETVYDIWEETPVEVEYIKHVVTNEGRMIGNFKVTTHGITDIYWKEFASSPEPEAGNHHYMLVEGVISEAISNAYDDIELTHEEEVMMGWVAE